MIEDAFAVSEYSPSFDLPGNGRLGKRLRLLGGSTLVLLALAGCGGSGPSVTEATASATNNDCAPGTANSAEQAKPLAGIPATYKPRRCGVESITFTQGQADNGPYLEATFCAVDEVAELRLQVEQDVGQAGELGEKIHEPVFVGDGGCTTKRVYTRATYGDHGRVRLGRIAGPGVEYSFDFSTRDPLIGSMQFLGVTSFKNGDTPLAPTVTQ